MKVSHVLGVLLCYATPRIYNASVGLSHVYSALDCLVKNRGHSQFCDFCRSIYNFLPTIQLCIVLRLSQSMFFLSTQPHSHTHCIQSERRNYCTNFLDSKCHKNKPWCYTMNPKTVWAYCDIPKCREYSKIISYCLRCTCYYQIWQVANVKEIIL